MKTNYHDNPLFRLAQPAKRYPHLWVAIIGSIVFLYGGLIGGAIIGNVTLGSLVHAGPLLGEISFELKNIISFALAILLLGLWLWRVEGRSLWTAGLAGLPVVRPLLTGWLVSVGFIAAVMGLAWLNGSATVTLNQSTMGGLTAIALMLLIIPSRMVQGGAEELVFRGWMLPIVGLRHGRWVGIVASSIVFALVHVINAGFLPIALINITLIGLFIALYALREGGLWGVVALHAGLNWTQANLFGLSASGHRVGATLLHTGLSGSDFITGGNFGLENSVLMTLVALVAVAFELFLARRAAAQPAHDSVYSNFKNKEQFMKRSFFLWSLVVLILLAGCQPIVAPASAPEATSQVETYVDPAGRFNLPIPTNWRASQTGDHAVLQSPQGLITIWIGAYTGLTSDEAVVAAWRMVDPLFGLEPQSVQEAPSRTGITRTLVYRYDGGTDKVVQAVTQEHATFMYVTLVQGASVEFERRAAQVSIILTGFTPAGVQEVNLQGIVPATLSPAKLDELSAYIEEALVRFDVPGTAVAVAQGGEVVLLQGYGVRKRGSDAPITPQTRMMIGSTGKTMTTMLMAQLVDEGVMSWDTPVQTILPQFAVSDPELSQRITVRNLVCACTGVPRRDMEFVFNADELSAEAVIESLQSFEFFTDFGEAFQYSNQLVATGGWVAAAAAGGEYGNLDQAYFDTIEERIYTPMGMANTTFSFNEVLASDNFALPHAISATGERTALSVDSERFLLSVAPAGASWSTAEDMARYLLTELNSGVSPDDTQIVSAENLGVTWKPQVPVAAKMSYGLGWFVDEYKGQRLIQHGGNTVGFSTDFAFLPDADLGIVVITNGQVTNAFNQAIRHRLFELAFDQPHEHDAVATFTNGEMLKMARGMVAATVAVDPAQVGDYVGRYHNAALGEVQVRVEGEHFLLDLGGWIMEMRALVNEAGEVERYITSSPGMLGYPVVFVVDTAETVSMTFGEGVEQYQFTKLE